MFCLCEDTKTAVRIRVRSSFIASLANQESKMRFAPRKNWLQNQSLGQGHLIWPAQRHNPHRAPKPTEQARYASTHLEYIQKITL